VNVAIVHEWLTDFAGAENVLEQMFSVTHPSRLFTLVDHMARGRKPFLDSVPVETSLIQKLPFSRNRYRGYLPLMPMAIEQLDVTGFDMVVSSHYCVAHGVLTRPDQPHLAYTHSPVRYAWDLQHQYLDETGISRSRMKNVFARAILHYIRQWDHVAGQRPDFYSCNSRFIARRIAKYYRRTARVIYPPVDVDRFQPGPSQREDYYVTASRMVPYKKISLIVKAFSRMPGRRLIVIGSGPEEERIRQGAGANISFLGYQSNDVLHEHLRHARAFVFAALEDFGILPVEAQACGTPVIALGHGGTAETVIDGETGVLFEEQTVDSLKAAIQRFEDLRGQLDAERIRVHAEQFSTSVFRHEFANFIDQSLEEFHKGQSRSARETKMLFSRTGT